MLTKEFTKVEKFEEILDEVESCRQLLEEAVSVRSATFGPSWPESKNRGNFGEPRRWGLVGVLIKRMLFKAVSKVEADWFLNRSRFEESRSRFGGFWGNLLYSFGGGILRSLRLRLINS
jgi:hypothetical protein